MLSACLRVSHSCRYCFYSVVQKLVFRPVEATRCPNKREIWQGERTAGLLSHAKFHVYRGKNVGIQPPKLSEFRIFVRNLCLRSDSFTFLRNSQRLYALTGSFYVLVWSLSTDKHSSYKHFPAVGEFSHTFSIARSGETTDRIKKC